MRVPIEGSGSCRTLFYFVSPIMLLPAGVLRKFFACHQPHVFPIESESWWAASAAMLGIRPTYFYGFIRPRQQRRFSFADGMHVDTDRSKIMSRKFAEAIEFFGNYSYYRRLGYSARKAWRLAGATLPN